MMHIVGKMVWVITALVAINAGTTALFGFDALANLPIDWIKPVSIFIGLCGVASLLLCCHRSMERCAQCPHCGRRPTECHK